MRPSRRHSLSAADDRPSAVVLPRGAAAASGRSGGALGRRGGKMRSPFAERERDRLIEAVLPDVAFDGWSRRGLRGPAQRVGIPAGEAEALVPPGAADAVAR